MSKRSTAALVRAYNEEHATSGSRPFVDDRAVRAVTRLEDWDRLYTQYHGDTYLDRDPMTGVIHFDRPLTQEELDAGHGW